MSDGQVELRLLADLHLLHALGPALDDAAERERRRLTALARAVEHGAVDQRAGVVDLHRSVGRRGRAGARLRGPDDQRPTASSPRRARATRPRRPPHPASSRSRRASAARSRVERVDLRSVRLEIDGRLLLVDGVGQPGLDDLQLARRQIEDRRVAPDASGRGRTASSRPRTSALHHRARPQPAAAASINVTAIRFFMGPLVTRVPPAHPRFFEARASDRTSLTGFQRVVDRAGRLTARICFTVGGIVGGTVVASGGAGHSA